jgi:hypothetical protein
MVEYLEGVHQGEFISGTIKNIYHDVNNRENSDGYQPPTTNVRNVFFVGVLVQSLKKLSQCLAIL